MLLKYASVLQTTALKAAEEKKIRESKPDAPTSGGSKRVPHSMGLAGKRAKSEFFVGTNQGLRLSASLPRHGTSRPELSAPTNLVTKRGKYKSPHWISNTPCYPLASPGDSNPS
jgi:hypothetical protein